MPNNTNRSQVETWFFSHSLSLSQHKTQNSIHYFLQFLQIFSACKQKISTNNMAWTNSNSKTPYTVHLWLIWNLWFYTNPFFNFNKLQKSNFPQAMNPTYNSSVTTTKPWLKHPNTSQNQITNIEFSKAPPQFVYSYPLSQPIAPLRKLLICIQASILFIMKQKQMQSNQWRFT